MDIPVLAATVRKLGLRKEDVHVVLNHQAYHEPDLPWAMTKRTYATNVSDARNHCLSAVRETGHELFAFLDADDYYSADWLDLVRGRLENADACALAPGWTSAEGELIRFTFPSESTLGGTLAGRVTAALPFIGSLGEDEQWGRFMRAAGRRVVVPEDPRGYCYVVNPAGTARFDNALVKEVRGPHISYGMRPPSDIDVLTP